jgi:hypothetical protein
MNGNFWWVILSVAKDLNACTVRGFSLQLRMRSYEKQANEVQRIMLRPLSAGSDALRMTGFLPRR